MSIEVRHFPKSKFFVVSSDTVEVRYFNGKKYLFYRKMEHYVIPGEHRSWSARTVMVTTESRPYHHEITRFSCTEFHPKY